MRYRDAAHINLDSFYARKPQAGRWFRVRGYGLFAFTVAVCGHPDRVAVLLVIGLVVWILAWKSEVGALWRSALVAQILLAASILTWPSFRGWTESLLTAGKG